MCDISQFKHLKLDEPHRIMLEKELLDWHSVYLPPGGLSGFNVLDIGAGCGETAQFFLNHGARSVRPVEKDPTAFSLLKENFAGDPRISWDGPFQVDFIKSDCEGGERNMVIETHFPVFIRPLHNSKISCPCSNVWTLTSLPFGSKVWATWLLLRQIHIQIRHYLSKWP